MSNNLKVYFIVPLWIKVFGFVSATENEIGTVSRMASAVTSCWLLWRYMNAMPWQTGVSGDDFRSKIFGPDVNMAIKL